MQRPTFRHLLTVLAIAAWGTAEGAASSPPSADEIAIRTHIDSIFRAYIAGDRETIRATHAADWCGFLSQSRAIIRGLDSYMEAADTALQRSRMVGYEMLDLDIQFHGDVAVVPYVAALDLEIGGTPLPIRPKLRVLDVYEKRDGEWIQIASNTGPHPETQEAARRLPSPVGAALRSQLLAAREAVWRAWFAGDGDLLSRYLPAEAVTIDAEISEWHDRDEVLSAAAGFAAGGGRLLELEFPRTEIQVYGDVAILYSSYRLAFQSGDDVQRTAGRATEIFVRRQDGWVNSGWHLDAGP